MLHRVGQGAEQWRLTLVSKQKCFQLTRSSSKPCLVFSSPAPSGAEILMETTIHGWCVLCEGILILRTLYTQVKMVVHTPVFISAVSPQRVKLDRESVIPDALYPFKNCHV